MKATYLRKGQGKSDNAYYAQSCGKWPLTKAIGVVAATLKPYYKLTRLEIRIYLEMLGSCEWHHVGRYAAACEYYDCQELVDCLMGNTEYSTFWDSLDCDPTWKAALINKIRRI